MECVVKSVALRQHGGLPCSERRARRALPRAAACPHDETPPIIHDGNVEAFRARLIAAEGDISGRLRSSNLQLLRLQNPALAVEEAWAEPAAGPAPGGLLLATSQTARLLGEEYRQAVIFLLQHTSRGSLGLVLNRPSAARVRQGPHGLPEPAHGAADGLPNSRLYWGGAHSEHVVTLLHGGERPELAGGSREVAPGIHVLFGQAQVAEVAAGDLGQAGTPLRFFTGACTWGPGALEEQVLQGAWMPATGSRGLVLKHAVDLPVRLWEEVVGLLRDACAVYGTAPACFE